ncbi:flagellar basal body P-ring formation chaperone FlgA [Acuticoccus yangtzensis]|uniref:flagellar basal body P-ring formation chaperone FlgA n=1 Tax=Acuticoccus yangtzensis TaxID=1443441 RepID=UPI0009498748|nr:flagellar basal body P-ring formation chaperone FlgA [Acuticoccus yangtzensis]ORE95801.1 flagellar basal body P-ring biosynthesis protein-like protein [Stappia sp. 22II-S9-Z10]
MPSARSLTPIGGAALALVLSAVAGHAVDTSGGLLPVPAVTINRGDVVSADMLTEKHFYYDPDRPLSVMTDPSAAIGRQARRTLHPGKPIPLNAFQAAKVVFRGKPTEARFRMGNLTITTTVLPQADGGVGDIVQARNLDSNRLVSGIVGMDGSIEVSAP